MNENEFWQLIDDTRQQSKGDNDLLWIGMTAI